MVCFTQSRFRFAQLEAEGWFNLLAKLYPDIPMDVNGQTGSCSIEWFTSLPKAPAYTVTTVTMWSELACIQAMPAPPTDFFVSSNESNPLSEKIDSVIEGRLSAGSLETKISSLLKVDNFEELVEALKASHHAKPISRLYISKMDQTILLVLHDRHALKITCDKVRDSNLPTFDPDDGFSSRHNFYIPTEWHGQFNTWVNRQVATHFQSWNDPILVY